MAEAAINIWNESGVEIEVEEDWLGRRFKLEPGGYIGFMLPICYSVRILTPGVVFRETGSPEAHADVAEPILLHAVAVALPEERPFPWGVLLGIGALATALGLAVWGSQRG